MSKPAHNRPSSKTDCPFWGLVREVIETPLKELKASVAEMEQTVNTKMLIIKKLKTVKFVKPQMQIPPLVTHYTANVPHQQN